MIDDTSTIRRKPDLITTNGVVLDPATGTFFELNASAARMWEMIETPQTLAMLVEQVTAHFDVSAEACRSDLAALIGDLRERGLVETV